MKPGTYGITAILLLAACIPAVDPAPRPNRTELVVFAAASLTKPFNEIGRLFEEENPALKVTFSFGGSQQLRSQLDQGARADLFAPASLREMEKARLANLVDDYHVFAHNELTVILPKGSGKKVARLQDLAKPGLKLDVANRDVPVGSYTLAALDKMSADPSFGPDFKRLVLANVKSEEDSVRKVVAKVLLGEADAGIVYSSDISRDVRPGVETIAIPSQFNVVADYPIALVRDSRHPAEARALMDFVLSAKGQSVLASRGFILEGKQVE